MSCRIRNNSEQQESSVIRRTKKFTEIPGKKKPLKIHYLEHEKHLYPYVNSVEHSVLKLVIFILICFQLLAFFKQTMQNIWYICSVNWYQKMYLQKVAWKEKEIDNVEP